MQKLTSRDRVMKAINRQEPDRVPTFEIIINQKVINAIKTGSSYVDFCEYSRPASIVSVNIKRSFIFILVFVFQIHHRRLNGQNLESRRNQIRRRTVL